MNKLAYGLLFSLLVSFSPAYAEVSPDTIVDIFERMEKLERKARELHGKNEELEHQISLLKKQQKDGFLSIDERFDELAKSGGASSEKTSDDSKKEDQPRVKIIDKPESSTPSKDDEESKKKEDSTKVEESSNSEDTAKTDSSDKEKTAAKKSRAPSSYERETYQAAFTQMKTSPTAATKAFKEYIKMQPDSPLAANAQYWIGEIMYSHNNYKGAVQEFIVVLQKYKYSDKAPDAAIKLGYSFYALKNWVYARRTFEDVLRYFPNNKNAVNLAKKRLEVMKAAGN